MTIKKFRIFLERGNPLKKISYFAIIFIVLANITACAGKNRILNDSIRSLVGSKNGNKDAEEEIITSGQMKMDNGLIIRDEEEDAKVLSGEETEQKNMFIRKIKLSNQPLAIYRGYLDLNYQKIYYEDDDIENSEFAAAYTYYFGGIPDYPELPIDLQPWLMRKTNLTIGGHTTKYSRIFEISSSDYSWDKEEIEYEYDESGLEIGIETFLRPKKKIGLNFQYVFAERDWSYEWDYYDEEGKQEISLYGYGLKYYAKENCLLYLSIEKYTINENENENLETSEYKSTTTDIGVEYLLGVSFKFVLGRREIDADNNDEVYLYSGVNWYHPNNKTSISARLGDDFNSYSLSHYFTRSFKIELNHIEYSDDYYCTDRDLVRLVKRF